MSEELSSQSQQLATTMEFFKVDSQNQAAGKLLEAPGRQGSGQTGKGKGGKGQAGGSTAAGQGHSLHDKVHHLGSESSRNSGGAGDSGGGGQGGGSGQGSQQQASTKMAPVQGQGSRGDDSDEDFEEF